MSNGGYLRNLERKEDLEFVGVFEASLMLDILLKIPELAGSEYGP